MAHSLADISIKLAFIAFSRFQFGNGFVAFRQSETEAAAGCYDPHIMFVHDDSDNRDEAAMKAVEKDCADLARLLNRFRIADEFVSDKTKACGI